MKLPLDEINWYFINQLEILQPKKRSDIYVYIFQTRNYSYQTFPQFLRMPPELSPNYEIVNSKQETILIRPFLDFSGCRRNVHVRP